MSLSQIFLKCFLLIGMCLYVTGVFAQDEKSKEPLDLKSLNKKILQLQEEINRLKAQLRETNAANAATDSIDNLIHIPEKDNSSTEGDQIYRKERLDDLVEAFLERPGRLNFKGDATAIIQGLPYGKNDFASAAGSFDFYAFTKLGKDALLFIDLEAIGGNGPNDNISTFASLNEDAGSTQDNDGLDRLSVLEAWAEFTAWDGSVKITAGKIDLTNYFDINSVANDETAQFISSAFVNSAAFAVPANSPGFRMRAEFVQSGAVQIAIVSVDNSGNKFFSDLFKILSLNFANNASDESNNFYRV